jgi:hypothetical protein
MHGWLASNDESQSSSSSSTDHAHGYVHMLVTDHLLGQLASHAHAGLLVNVTWVGIQPKQICPT